MSFLIVGGQEEERRQKAVDLARKFKASQFDTIFIEGETSIGIEQIRDLQRKICLKPFNSSSKIAIIHPGELLTLEAQNALLKTLEETGETTILILTAGQKEALLPTVVSRCQIIRLRLKPKLDLTDKDFETYLKQLLLVIQSKVGERLKFAGKIAKEKEKIKDWLNIQLIILHELLLFQSGVPSQFFKTLPDTAKQLKIISKKELVEMIKNLEETLSMLEQNVNPRLALEVFLLELPYN